MTTIVEQRVLQFDAGMRMKARDRSRWRGGGGQGPVGCDYAIGQRGEACVDVRLEVAARSRRPVDG